MFLLYIFVVVFGAAAEFFVFGVYMEISVVNKFAKCIKMENSRETKQIFTNNLNCMDFLNKNKKLKKNN